jgi:hypothetical protein
MFFSNAKAQLMEKMSVQIYLLKSLLWSNMLRQTRACHQDTENLPSLSELVLPQKGLLLLCTHKRKFNYNVPFRISNVKKLITLNIKLYHLIAVFQFQELQ